MSDDNLENATPEEPFQAGEGAFGSIAKGLAGDYDLTIGGVLSEAWSKVKGNKGLLVGAILLFYLTIIVIVGLTTLLQLPFATAPEETTTGGLSIALSIVSTLLLYGINSAMTAGIILLGAKVSMGRRCGAGDIYKYLNRFFKALFTYILMVVMILIGFFLLVVPGIYLTFAYIPATALALEKDMSPWEALETSRKVVTKRWFTYAGLYMVTGLLLMLGLLTLGIAWIWLLPLTMLVYGISYRNMFGVEPET